MSKITFVKKEKEFKFENMESELHKGLLSNLNDLHEILWTLQELKELGTGNETRELTILEVEEDKIVEWLNKNGHADHYKKQLAKAKELDEKVIYTSHREDCNSRKEQCDIDLISEYVHPDGSLTTERIHTC